MGVHIFHICLKNTWDPLGSWEAESSHPKHSFKAATRLSSMGETQVLGNPPKPSPVIEIFSICLQWLPRKEQRASSSTEKK